MQDTQGGAQVTAEMRKEVLGRFQRNGVSVAAWARTHNLSPALVHRILKSDALKCTRGDSHRAAVLLGLKQGVAIEAAKFDPRLAA